MRCLLKGKFKLFREQKGFSLLEILVTVGILAVIGTGLLTALNNNARATRTLDEQVVGGNLAVAYLEAIKELPYSDNYSSAGDNIFVPMQYSVTIDIQYSDNGTNWVDSHTDEVLQMITVRISREGGKPVTSICTLRTKR